MAHLSGEGAVRFPLSGFDGSGLFHHLVDLFKGEALCLRDEEEGEYEAAYAERAPDEEHFGAQVGLIGSYEEGGDDGDDLVSLACV